MYNRNRGAVFGGSPSIGASKILNFSTVRPGWIKFSEWVDIKNKLNPAKIGCAQSWTALFRAFSSHRQPSAIFSKVFPAAKIGCATMGVFPPNGPSKIQLFDLLSWTHEMVVHKFSTSPFEATCFKIPLQSCNISLKDISRVQA